MSNTFCTICVKWNAFATYSKQQGKNDLIFCIVSNFNWYCNNYGRAVCANDEWSCTAKYNWKWKHLFLKTQKVHFWPSANKSCLYLMSAIANITDNSSIVLSHFEIFILFHHSFSIVLQIVKLPCGVWVS